MRRRNRHYDARGRRLAPRPPDPPEGMMYWMGHLLKIKNVEEGCKSRVGWNLQQHWGIQQEFRSYEKRCNLSLEHRLKLAGV